MARFRPLPPIDELRRRLAYRSDGVLIWKRPPSARVKAGSVAGAINNKGNKGYRVIRFDNELYLVHRIAWAIVKREDPLAFEIDHINGNKLDNRMQNLRKASRVENNRNKKRVKGYTFCKKKEKWKAQIRANSKNNNLGYFDTEEQAREAYLRAKEKLHGEFMPTDMKHELGQIDGPTSQLDFFND